MTTAIVGQTYARTKLLARELGIDDAVICSAHSPRAMDGLSADRWLIEFGVNPMVVDLVKDQARKRPGATVEYVRLGRRPQSG